MLGCAKFPHLQVVHGALRSNSLQIHQVRFRANRIALVHPSSGVIQITICTPRRILLQLIAHLFKVLPVPPLGGALRQGQPGFRKIRAEPNRLSPFSLGLLGIAFFREGNSQLVMRECVFWCVLCRRSARP